MKNELIQARVELDQIPVAGEAVRHLFMAQTLLEKVIGELPDDPQQKPEQKAEPKPKKEGK